MGSARGIAHFLVLFLFAFRDVHCQQCSTAQLAPTDVLETVQIYSNEYALEDDHIAYEISPSAPSNSFDQVSDSIRILTSNQSACPADCTVTLNRYTDSFQTAGSTVLFFDTEHSFYLPSHYIKDNTTTFVCAAANGSCGATVPIYRYYKIISGGVYHAYSLDQDVLIDGYNQEFLPICYAWPVSSTVVAASRPTCGTLNFDIPPTALSDLNIFDNSLEGIERDHYFTTLPSSDLSLVDYNQTGVLGKVLTSAKSTACSCLVKLQQQFDNQTGYFHRRDHKLVVTGQEPNRPYEEYVDTGETVYCAKRLGDCGATLPLWKQFQFYDVDTVYTTDSTPLSMSYFYPQTPLCYIWSSTYSPNAANIVTGIPPVPTAPATMGTTVSGGTPATTASTISVGGTSGSTQSTISVWGTSGSTVSGATMPTTGTTASTISVWGTVGSTTSGSTPTTGTTASTISVWGTSGSTVSGATTGTTSSTVSVWGTSGSTPSSFGTTPTTGTTASTPSSVGTTIRLSDPGLNIPVTPVFPTTPEFQETDSYSPTPETFTLSDTFMTPTTTSSMTGSTPKILADPAGGTMGPTLPPIFLPTGSTSPPGGTLPPIVQPTSNLPPITAFPSVTLPPIFSETLPPITLPPAPTGSTLAPGLSTPVSLPPIFADPTSSSSGAPGSPETTPVPIPMITGPLILIIPTAPPATPGSSAPTDASPGSSSSSLPEVSPTPTTLASASPATPSPQHVAQAAPTYSIVGGALDSFTNAPIIAAMISSSSALSTPPTTESASTPVVMMSLPLVATTEEPGIIWKAGDWISNTWHSVFGGNDQASPSTAPTPSENVSPTTPVPLGGLVGSVINSTGNIFNDTKNLFGNTMNESNSSSPISTFLNSTGNFFEQHLSSNSSFVNNTKNWIDDKLGDTGKFLTNAWNSLGSENNTFVNNTQTWIGGAINSTGGFLTDSWNSLGNSNGTAGQFLNGTKTWVEEAAGSTGEFLSNAWNSLGSENNTFVNNTQTWIGGAINSTGGFLTNSWNSLGNSNGTAGQFLNGTKTWVEGAAGSTGEFLSNAWNSLSSGNGTSGTIFNGTKNWVDGAVDSTGDFLSNAWNSLSSGNSTGGIANSTATPLALPPMPVENLVLPPVNDTTTVAPIQWNGGIVNGPLNG